MEKLLTKPGWIAALVLTAIVVQVLVFRALRQYESLLHLREAIVHMEKEQPADAAKRAEKALSADPYNGYGYYYVGSSSLVGGKNSAAVEALQRARAYMPHLPNILRLMGQALFYLNKFADATRVLEEYFHIDPNPHITPDYMWRLRAEALHRNEQLGEASVELANAEKLPTYRNELLQFRVANALMLNQVTYADYCFKRLRQFNPAGNVEAAAILNEALQRGKLQTLLRYIQMLRLRGEADPGTLKAAALALIRKDRLDEAVSILNQVRRIAPADADAYLFLGDIYARRKAPQLARPNYQRHLDLNPNTSAREAISRYMAETETTSTAVKPPAITSSGATGTSEPVRQPAP